MVEYSLPEGTAAAKLEVSARRRGKTFGDTGYTMITATNAADFVSRKKDRSRA